MSVAVALTRRLRFPSSAARLVFCAGALIGGLTSGWAQNTARPSPFMQKQAPVAKADAAPQNTEYQLSGVTKIGADVMVCITTVADKRSRWLKVGETDQGFRVLSFDPEKREAVVEKGGRQHALVLKQPTYDPAALAAYQNTAALPSGPLPSAGVAQQVALTDDEKATEARMLVSDLLEIGMIQRKAYQEAQTKKREDQNAAANDAASVTPPPQPAPEKVQR